MLMPQSIHLKLIREDAAGIDLDQRRIICDRTAGRPLRHPTIDRPPRTRQHVLW
jgi:hypothetical protein